MNTNSLDIMDRPIVLKRGVSLSALGVLFRMTIARLIRGKRLLVLLLLFSLPLLVAALTQRYSKPYDPDKTSLIIIFTLIPLTLLPLTALIFASGMIQDEIDEQTITYLLIRPIPRSLIYLTKLMATFLVTSFLTTLFTVITYVVCYANSDKLWTEIFPWIPFKASAAMVAALAAYLSVFALVSVFTRRTVVTGIAYVTFEGIVVYGDFVIRKYTVIYQFTVIVFRWIGFGPTDWSLDPATAPTASDAALNLVWTTVACAIIGAIAFTRREFRVKTPEGT